jgi:HK97 family phage major capsid protein
MTLEELMAAIRAMKDAVAARDGKNDETIQKLLGRFADLEQHVAGMGSAPAIRGGGNSLLAAINGPEFQQRLNAIREGAPSTGRIQLKNGGQPLGIKSTIINLPEGGSPASGFPTQPQRAEGYVGPVQRPLSILDVLPVIPVSSNAYQYVRVSHVNNADVQNGEGSVKPSGTIETELVTVNIATLAESFTASNQCLSDNPQLATFLNSLLAYDVRAKIEHYAINGDANDPEGFDGLLTAAPTLVTTETLAPDIISEGLTVLSTAGYQPGFVALHPLDFHRLRTLKSAGGSEEYLVGSWATPSAPNVWNTPIVVSPALQEGEGLIVDPSRVALLDRQQVTAMVSTEHADYAIRNLVLLLTEARAGFAIFDDGGIGKVNLPVPSP